MSIKPPIAKKIPKKLIAHEDVRLDNYFWLNDRDNKDVIEYLKAENEYFETKTSHTRSFQEGLYEELRGRIQEEDESVPYILNGYEYKIQYLKGKEYPIYTRRKLETATFKTIFDVNVYAKGHAYYKMTGMAVSPDNTWASYGEDTVSRKEYTIKFKNLINGQTAVEAIANTTGSGTWANDNKTFFYTRKNPVTLRAEKIYKHILGTDPSQDELIYHEEDETFDTYVYKSRSREYIIIGSRSTLTSKYRFIKAENPTAEFQEFSPQERGLEYSIFHFKDHFYILTNADGATNFKVMKTNVNSTSRENWEEFISHRADVLLEDIELFEKQFVLTERANGLTKLKVVSWDGNLDYYIPIKGETYVAGIFNNPEFNTTKLRYYVSQMTAPYQVLEYDMADQTQEIIKESKVMDVNFSPENYISERLWAVARDGVQIPISIVRHKNTSLNPETPILQYAYGSYGATIDPSFSSNRLSLLDRGFAFAIAHIRGGEYLGRSWYENGKMLKKKNTFFDFIDCSKFLIEQRMTSPRHLYASGGSAGGLLMGVVLNEAPELYNGVIADVPFVDVVTTMLDDSIPLTTGEYDEWGNPHEKIYYDYMLSYSPYDNVKKIDYPNLMVLTGLHDSQVQYWEPAKWVAKLRDYKTDHNDLLFYTDMEVGHGGASGRFEYLKEVARDYAFLLDLEGKIEQN